MYQNIETDRLYLIVLANAKEILQSQLVEDLRSEIEFHSIEKYNGLVSVKINSESTLEFFLFNKEQIFDESLKLNHYVEIPDHLTIGDIVYFDYCCEDPEIYFDNVELYDTEEDWRFYLLNQLSLIDSDD